MLRSCSTSKAPRNYFSGEDHSALLREKVASSVDSFQPPNHPPSCPSCSRKWSSWRKKKDGQGREGPRMPRSVRGTLWVEMPWPWSWWEWGREMGLPSQVTVFRFTGGSRQRTPTSPLHPVPPAMGKFLQILSTGLLSDLIFILPMFASSRAFIVVSKGSEDRSY